MSGRLILDVFIGIAAAAVAVMLTVALYGSRNPVPQSVVSAKGYAVRRWWVWVVACIAVAGFILTLPDLPYPSAATLGRHYRVVAQQYGFTLPAVIPAGVPVVFDVTSRDVNHGFGVYDAAGRIIGQVQAMPSYVNHLPFVFHERGHYTVRCLEYCGIAHASMQGGFDVR